MVLQNGGLVFLQRECKICETLSHQPCGTMTSSYHQQYGSWRVLPVILQAFSSWQFTLKALREEEEEWKVLQLFFFLFLIPHSVPLRVSHADSTQKKSCERIDKYCISCGISQINSVSGCPISTDMVIKINILWHYLCFPQLWTMVTKSEARRITVEE